MILLMSRDSIFQSTVGGMIWLMPALLSGGSPRRWALWDSTGMPCMQSTPNYMPFKFPDTYLIDPSPVTGHLCVGKNAPTPVNTWSVTWRKTCEIVVRHIHELSPQVFEFLNSLITLPLLVILKDAASIYLWKFRRAQHGIWEAAVTAFMDYRDERKKKNQRIVAQSVNPRLFWQNQKELVNESQVWCHYWPLKFELIAYRI